MKNLKEIRIHPIKSTKHIRVEQCVLKKYGIQYDREWALFDKDDQVITSRSYPRLLDITCQIEGDNVAIHYGSAQHIITGENKDDYQPVHIFSYDAHGYGISTELDKWFSDYLNTPCRLLKVSSAHQRPVLSKHGGTKNDIVGFGDQAPLLILSNSSLDDLNERLDETIGMERFRPNFVLDGTDAYEEDHWDIISIGKVQLRVIQQCERCVLTTIDNRTKQKHPKGEPLRTLNKYRKGLNGGVVFGVHAVPITTGTIYQGDKIVVLNTIDRTL